MYPCLSSVSSGCHPFFLPLELLYSQVSNLPSLISIKFHLRVAPHQVCLSCTSSVGELRLQDTSLPRAALIPVDTSASCRCLSLRCSGHSLLSVSLAGSTTERVCVLGQTGMTFISTSLASTATLLLLSPKRPSNGLTSYGGHFRFPLTFSCCSSPSARMP